MIGKLFKELALCCSGQSSTIQTPRSTVEVGSGNGELIFSAVAIVILNITLACSAATLKNH
jgi:hypothetical protein